MGLRQYYKYKIEFTYEYKGQHVVIKPEHIHTLIIDYDYDNLNMPVTILRVALDKKIVDNMIENINKKTMILHVYKYGADDNIKIYRDYIRDEFTYIISDDKNNEKDLDYPDLNKVNEKDDKIVSRIINIGLIKLSLINNNKKFINGIFKDSSIASIIFNYASHMKFLVEPVNKNTPPKLIIPPMDSFTKFIKYLDDNFNLYNTDYRLFYDFDKTYLLSSSGDKVESRDELYSNIILNIHDTVKDQSKIRGNVIDPKQKAYVIDVDRKDVSININHATNLSYQNTISINSIGENNISDIPNSNRIRLERFPNQNLSINVDNEEDVVINIMKQELDTSIFTINKEYHIKNYDDHDKEGKFILLRKKEIFIRENEDYNLMNLLTFKKVKS